MRNKKKALILANLLPQPVIARGIKFAQTNSKECVIYKPFKEPRRREFPVDITVEAERVVFIVEL